MPEMPSGAVTFLFTDIEGSTRLVKQLRDAYPAVLSKHQSLLRAAFAAHGGYEVDTQGDSFFVAFASAREGLLAAVEGQLALHSNAWPDGVEIKVRMGLHTGQAVASDGRYTGLAVHRAARIGAAGHGEQILVSQATQTLLEDEEEDLRVSLRDLGEQRLKDLDRPVRLFQAVAEGLPDSFPPVRGDAHLAQAAEAAIARPPWRRPRVALAAMIALLCVAVLAAALLVRGGSSGGLGGIRANHVGLIDLATNEIVAEVPVGIRPGPVAIGAGAVWIGNIEDRNLTQVDPGLRTVAGTIELDDRTPTGIGVGLGSVWVAHGLLGEISRIDPQFGNLTGTTSVGGTAFGFPSGSVALDERSVWAVFGDSTLARLDAGGRILGEGLAGSQPAGIAVGDGAIWVTNSGDATVYRFHPLTFEEGDVRPVSVGRSPSGIAVGEGAVWVASTGGDAITRIDPTAHSTETIPVLDEPVAIAVSPGAIWVACKAAGAVLRIDPETNVVVETIEVGSAPSGVAVGFGYVWVTAQAP
jgi:class 3 adenylate cyclase/DNA-binding beta-propeller fold protein YncE